VSPALSQSTRKSNGTAPTHGPSAPPLPSACPRLPILLAWATCESFPGKISSPQMTCTSQCLCLRTRLPYRGFGYALRWSLQTSKLFFCIAGLGRWLFKECWGLIGSCAV
jgi:hypothetical protein